MKKIQSAKTQNGNEISLSGNGKKCKTLVIGVFHGDEPQGKFLIEKYLDEKKDSNHDRRRYVMETIQATELAINGKFKEIIILFIAIYCYIVELFII